VIHRNPLCQSVLCKSTPACLNRFRVYVGKTQSVAKDPKKSLFQRALSISENRTCAQVSRPPAVSATNRFCSVEERTAADQSFGFNGGLRILLFSPAALKLRDNAAELFIGHSSEA
jgi:hypothetical protein